MAVYRIKDFLVYMNINKIKNAFFYLSIRTPICTILIIAIIIGTLFTYAHTVNIDIYTTYSCKVIELSNNMVTFECILNNVTNIDNGDKVFWHLENQQERHKAIVIFVADDRKKIEFFYQGDIRDILGKYFDIDKNKLYINAFDEMSKIKAFVEIKTGTIRVLDKLLGGNHGER